MIFGAKERPAVDAPRSAPLPIQFEKGVGPQKAELLAKVGVSSIEDLLFYFPRDHQDRRVVPIRSAVSGKKIAIKGRVTSVKIDQVGKMLGQARATVTDASASISAVWFKRLSFKYDVFSAVKRDVLEKAELSLFGVIEATRDGVEMRVEDYEVLHPDETERSPDRIVPVYPLTEGLQDRWLRSLAARLVPAHAAHVLDPLPQSLRAEQKLPDLPEAIRQFHFPNSWIERDRARERLAFDEFFLLELALALGRQDREHYSKGFQFVPRKNLLTPFKQSLGYEFTRAQAKCINEIFRDMALPSPMNRLLQGDVGSGKTVVALSAALLAIENGYQAAFLAPTEILAGQHALSIAKFFSALPVRFALLTGSTPKPERKKILQDLEAGKINFLVGTHAILSEDVRFKALGLVVIDEQHRFGVRQRAKLAAKTTESASRSGLLEKIHPDVLIMTATPIPRTLALTLYGDLDVSVIDEMPAGRAPIKTYCSIEKTALDHVEAAVASGHQAYVVFPIIEESETLSQRSGKTVRAAVKEFERLEQRFAGRTLGLLHGQMPADEKKKVMDAFRAGKISILVATPVIEVGIDVPNATAIVIANPERFGLAQLHQLRGRVGRGSAASECVLMTDAGEADVARRLAIFCALSDGFKLAEEDLKLRGPGEIIGEAQHGVPLFRVGDLLRDGLLIARAREAAKTLVHGNVPLTMREFGVLNRTLQKRFGNKIQLSRVG